MKYYLAIDLGASSGRHIIGWQEEGKVFTKEVYRFPNQPAEIEAHLTWDIPGLLAHIKRGIEEARRLYPNIESFSIDTWGVDYVLIKEGQPLPPYYAYRDGRTADSVKKVHEILPFEVLYERTGTQFQPFNTLYQLYADKQSGRLKEATDFLMLPEYFLYCLTGVKAHEYTNATTTGLVSAQSGAYDASIIQALDLPPRLFQPLRQPGELVGEYLGMKAVLCPTHDTASAVEGIPMEENAPYISSGTWSLLGVKTPTPLTGAISRQGNWSNEGGPGYNRYQKNIMGMWLLNELRREIAPERSFPEITQMARESRFKAVLNANDPSLMAPASMKEAFEALLPERPREPGDYFRSALFSLANSYGEALSELEVNTRTRYAALYIVGGGAKNEFLNELTRETTGKQVRALPIEATVLGNLKWQMKCSKESR